MHFEAPTLLNLYFVHCLLGPEDPQGWAKFDQRLRRQGRDQKEYKKLWRQRNKSRLAARKKERYEKNKEQILADAKEYYQEKREALRARAREYRQKNKEKVRAQKKADAQKHRERVRRSAQNLKRRRLEKDPAYRLSVLLRYRTAAALRGVRKAGRSLDLLDCTPEEYVTYFERWFWPGMTWEARCRWEIDHIVPLSAFDLTDPTQQRRAFHYTNTRPLWKDDNLKKRARLDWTPAESKHPLPDWYAPFYSEAA